MKELTSDEMCDDAVVCKWLVEVAPAIDIFDGEYADNIVIDDETKDILTTIETIASIRHTRRLV